PVVIAPAMNDSMYANKVVADNIERLKKCGVKFIGPAKGRLACGREGLGRMSDVEDIVRLALGYLR
ncbi:MAG: flavoprotein, partial [Patescibacteria group bacterium]